MKRYSDEETAPDAGRASDAVFKPAWEPIDVFLVLAALLIVLILSATVAADYFPHNYTSHVHVYPTFLGDSISNQLIAAAEEHSAQKGWQTGRHRNYPTTDFPLRELDFDLILPEQTESVPFQTWLNDTLLEGSIFPMLRYHFNIASEPRPASGKLSAQLSLKDLFFVKYDADHPAAQRSLELHMDSSLLSFIISLSTQTKRSSKETGNAVADATNLRSDGQQQTNLENDLAESTPRIVFDGYKGGGTRFHHADEPLSSPKGSLLVFPSRLYHEGLEVTEGVRYIIVGFVNVHMDRSWNYFLYRFGRFSRCICVATHAGTLLSWEDVQEINRQDDKCYCMWGIQIYAHDVLSSLHELLKINPREPLTTQYLK